MALKVALTVAGSDSSGGAGIQADLKVFTVLGVYGASAITGVTAQNTTGVKEVLGVAPATIVRQIDAVAADIQVDAVKTGMVGTVEAIEVVAEALRRNKLARYVCDPVMFAKSGDALFTGDAAGAMRKHLLPLATVVTPNRSEAAILTGTSVDALTTVGAAREVAKKLVGMGARAAVVKGIAVDHEAVDLLFDGRDFTEFGGQSFAREKTHGSGCAFSAAITAGLAEGRSLVEAVDVAKQLVTLAIQFSDGQGRGTAPVNVLAFLSKKK